MILYTLLFSLGIAITSFTSTLSAGSEVIISWSIDGANPETIDFALLDGTTSFDNAALVGNILQGAYPSALSFKWKVPNVPSGDKYFIRVGINGDYRYSSNFSIAGSSKSVSAANSTPTSTPSPTPTPKSSLPTESPNEKENRNKDPNRRFVSSVSTLPTYLSTMLALYLF
eukprot:NODE_316_length_9983_cov_1.089741.p8 type:complete len:171 gc:universal NODE_316_length_9983_cov_1.089741:1166-1678(+)